MDGLFARLAARALGTVDGQRRRIRPAPAGPFAAAHGSHPIDDADPPQARVDVHRTQQVSTPEPSPPLHAAAGPTARTAKPPYPVVAGRTTQTGRTTVVQKDTRLVVSDRDTAADRHRPQRRETRRPSPAAAADSESSAGLANREGIADKVATRPLTPKGAAARPARALPVAPAPAPVSRLGSKNYAAAPPVRVTIGVIEVRAATPPSVAVQTPAPRAEPKPVLTIDAYLSERAEGRR